MSQDREPQFLGFLRRAVFHIHFFCTISFQEKKKGMETSPQKDCAAPHFRGYVDTLVSVHKQRLRILISHCKWPEGKNTAFFIPHCCFGGQNKRRQTFQSLVTNFAPDTTTLSHYFYNDKKKKIPSFVSRLLMLVSILSGPFLI